MELNEYQKQAMTTCMLTSDNFAYMFLNLVGEVGEFSSKVAKAIRKGICDIHDNQIVKVKTGYESIPEAIEADALSRVMIPELQKEAGDILWQLSGLCSVMGWDLEDIAQMNLDKLASRKQRGKIDGDGDNR